MNFTIEIEREEDGRWIAEVMELPGVLVYGQTRSGSNSKSLSFSFARGRR